ncbi:MAG: DUF202 domain-containing protein [Actinobacteria bacterium]|nr:DUF202 domain-containing protein [Actinomycetota bacterium]
MTVPVPGLQPERTTLAWRRLAVVLIALALAAPRVAWPQLGPVAVLPAAAIAGAGVWLVIRSQRRYRAARAAMAAGKARPLPDGMLPVVTTAAALALGGLALIVVAT